MSDKILFNQPFGSLKKLFEFVRLGWKDQKEAEVTVKVVSRRDEIPKWEDCPRNQFYFCVIRRGRGDRILMVKHHTYVELSCKGKAELLAPKDLLYTAWPEHKDMHCSECKQFSTRIDLDKKCVDCQEKEETLSLNKVL